MKGALGGLTMLVEVRVVGEGEGGVEGTKMETVGEGGDGGLGFGSGFFRWGCFVHYALCNARNRDKIRVLT